MSDIGYEQPQIDKQGARDNLAAHSHTAISQVFENMSPTEASAASDDYAKIADGWADDITTFAARIRRSSQSAWEGPAGEDSRRAVNDYATDATNLSLALQGLANRVDDAANAVLNTKNGMPAVVDDPQTILSPGDWFDGDGGVSEAEQNARVHVTNNYGAGMAAADAQIPVLPQPKDPVAVGPPGVGDPGVPGGTGPGGPGTSPSGDPADPQTPGEEPSGEQQPGEQQPAGEETTAGEPASTDTAGTTPEPTVPSTTGSPAVTPASTTTSTPPGSPGMPSGTPGSPGSPSGAPVAPMPGRTVPGTPSGIPGAMPAAATGAPPGSPAARGGMPMMGAPGAGRGGSGEDDRDRQTPDYLINEENTQELLGEEPRTIPGGVLGADTPAAQPAERPPGS
ncbi:hypothetical protein [Nocardia flavorosea]|uniref:Uncharacterized protein n=1 Tax=Nocardia flavorosea TaxID=53429 RepID=A0A846YFF3_9NOCA|nr:hypothetical protein [Nocardia flavorosea]NKY55888.1 hypothetical protein [Nocardia flavorosea]